MIKHLIFILLLSTYATLLRATELPGCPLRGNEIYQSFQNIELPFEANTVHTIYQDRKGLIWIGTRNGLYNYNGYSLHEFIYDKHANGNCIYSIIQIDDYHLCLGTDNGLIWFNLHSDRFETKPYPTDSIDAIRSLAEFNQCLWIGTRDHGVYQYDYIHQKLTHINDTEKPIYALEAANGRLFIGSYESLSYIDSKDLQRHFIDFPDQQKRMVNSLLWDEEEKCLWIGTEGYLYKYDITHQAISEQNFLCHVTFKSLAKDGEHRLLIGTDDGLYVYTPFSHELLSVTHDSRNPYSLNNNVIWHITCDNQQNVWLSTDKGVSISQTTNYYRFLHLSELTQIGDGNTLTSMMQDSKGDYWLGGDNGLIHAALQNDRSTQIAWYNVKDTRYSLHHNRIRKIYEDTEGVIWIATDGGVAHFDSVQKQFKYLNIEDPSGKENANWAYDIFEDAQGRLWIATYMGGLFIVDRQLALQSQGKDKVPFLYHLSKEQGLSPIIYQMEMDVNGIVWLNTQEGLACIHPRTLAVSFKGIYMDNMIYSGDHLWYSSLGKLFRYDVKSQSTQEIAYSQSSQHIYSFVKEGGNLWLSTTEGVVCLRMQDEKVTYTYPSTHLYLSGLYDRITHRIWWGEKDGLVSFSTTKNESAAFHKAVYITSILSNGRLLHAGEDYKGNCLNERHIIHLQRQEDITLELSTLSYQAQGKCNYYYRINKDEEWHLLPQSELSFTNLSGGTYTLQFCEADPTLHPEASITDYTLIVPYPWYLSQLAKLIYLIVFILSGYLITRGILQKSRKKYEEKEREHTLELSKLKMDFFVDMSHELKTPLSLIIAPLSKMISEVGSGKQREALESMHQNALKLNSLIHQILDFKQMEYESEHTLLRSHVDLCALIKGCIQNFHTLSAERGIQVDFESDKEEYWLNVDKLKMESVFINLLSNAIKYCPDTHGHIGVKLQEVNQQLQITVSDNGPGIQENELSLVFVRFFQGKNKSKHAEGTGIGLYLVKRNIEAHNGHIEMANHQGLMVTIILPLEGENAMQTLVQEEPEEYEQEESEKRCILIIDDNKEVVSFLAQALNEQYTCLFAYDGREGLKKAQQVLPSLIIIDQMMPHMNGMECCRAIRQYPPASSTPIIMLTAKDDADTEMDCIKAGADIFMSKPFDMRKLKVHIVQLMQKRELLKESMRLESITQPQFEPIETHNTDEAWLEEITALIDKNMENEEFNVSQLAEQMKTPAKQLYRRLKQLTGMTPVSYIRKLRMKKAAVLLAQNKFSVSEVMYLVGYSNASYFTKCFTEEFGTSPKQFAASQKE
jgi:signal transduction histidine kinase/ligand-binding sensor domain-containing protein/CheY-like chemotaxis protein/AraC-like DNA-binding protein